jgi:hypothetical protein
LLDTSSCVSAALLRRRRWRMTPDATPCIRRHTSAYVSIHQHPSASVSIRQHTPAYVSIR